MTPEKLTELRRRVPQLSVRTYPGKSQEILELVPLTVQEFTELLAAAEKANELKSLLADDITQHWRKPSRIFVCSMGDLFHEDVPFHLIDDILETCERASWHTYLVLTKRIERVYEYLDSTGNRLEALEKSGAWLGVTAENQEQADKRIPILLQIPAAKRFVSVEPMLGPVNLSNWLLSPGWVPTYNNPDNSNGDLPSEPTNENICWVICGGETGPGARPMHPDWVRSLRDQCQAAEVPFFFKNWGEYVPGQARELLDGKPGWCYFQNGSLSPSWSIQLGPEVVSMKVGKKAASRILDGRTWDEIPGEADQHRG